jgi:Cu(I)/Ag(I) efflux system protein CusF
MIKLIPFAALLAALAAVPAITVGQGMQSGTMMEHGSMAEGGAMHGDEGAGATGEGVINSVDAEKGVVNVTHGPIPALSWPEMTMDLPVAEGVDLGGVQAGDDVRFRVVLGADQVYRITEIDASP